MSTTVEELRQKQLQQAEELFFSGEQKAGFAKDLFFGRFRAAAIMRYPQLPAAEQAKADAAVKEVREFVAHELDADAIDRHADIPAETIRGLADVGLMGAAVSPEYGGRGYSQQIYCRMMEVIGAHCGSTAVFVNAHHSIGLRALALFGTLEQKQRWLRALATAEQLAAFALTEPEAGSDAANVRTRAVPTPDGTGYVLNGQKRYITNGGIAGVLTVMARTPDPKDPDGKVTAFLVTPDMPGFEVVDPRMEKVGIRGTATARLAFHDMFVPRENILGEIGKGLKLALTVLDYGRTTFGATCTGAAKYCLERSVAYAKERIQFGRPIGEYELIKEKIAQAAADTYAMESAVYHTAALLDSGAHDYMLETSMLKVFASDRLWRIVNDALQIHGGAGFFTDQPFERMMRDARLNLIGEGANEVLRCFNAMVGLRNLGEELKAVRAKPWNVARLWRPLPEVPVADPSLAPGGLMLARQIRKFGYACIKTLVKYREAIIDAQYVQARLGDIATELFHSSCVLSRLNSLATAGGLDSPDGQRQLQTGLLYITSAYERNRRRFEELARNQDRQQTAVANAWLQTPVLPM